MRVTLQISGVEPKKWNREKGDILKKGRHENGKNESKVRSRWQYPNLVE